MLKTLGSIQRTAKTILWAVILLLAIVGIITVWDTIGKWIAILGGGLGAIYGGSRITGPGRNLSDDGDIKQMTEKREQLKTEAESWREKLDKLRQGSLILILCAGSCFVAGPAWAAIEGDIYIPEDYEELKVLYIEAMELLNEADKLILEYQSLAADQATTIQDQATMIDELEQDIFRLSRPVWGITGGVELGESAGWRLGVARKTGALSFSGGVGGGDSFCVWGSVTLWLMNPF